MTFFRLFFGFIPLHAFIDLLPSNMNVSQFFKMCILVGVTGTIFTGIAFMMTDSSEDLVRDRMKAVAHQFRMNRSNPGVPVGRADSGDFDENNFVDHVDIPVKESEVFDPARAAHRMMETGQTFPAVNNVGDAAEQPPLTGNEHTNEAAQAPNPEQGNSVQEAHETEAAVKETEIKEPEPPSPTKSPLQKAEVNADELQELHEAKKSTGVVKRDPSVHIFYYPWYDSPAYNSSYLHWNHEYLPHWSNNDGFPTGSHVPPDDIGSWFYPSLGLYSSRDPVIVDQHMQWISNAGIDVVVICWIPEKKTDAHANFSWDSLMPMYLNATQKYKLKLAFHLEPYEGRSADSVRNDIAYIIGRYSTHPAFYRTTHRNKTTKQERELPLFYIYDSYQIPEEQWIQIASCNGSRTIRGTPIDALLIGLYVNYNDRFSIQKAGFDGMYTYFASDGFSHGSSMNNWPGMSTFCAKNGMLFIPSVGPGYIDTRVRAWNDANTKDRHGGEYYKEHFKMAHTAKADIVSITSFNEWHEGTQIEPAVPHVNDKNITYLEYERNPEEYLKITRDMVELYFTPHHENIPMQIARIV